MLDPANKDLAARLRKLPGQILLAMVNGTAILVILAAILAMIATSKITHLAQNVATTMTDTVLSEVGESPKKFVESIESISADIHTLTEKLTDAKSSTSAALEPKITALNERISSLETALEDLQAARSDLMDELASRVVNAVGDAFQQFRTCPGPASASTSGT